MLLPAETPLKENLSSYQIATILDALLLEAIRPLAHHTKVLQYWLSEMMPLIVSDGRRKVSKIPQQELISLMFSAVMTQDPEKLLQIIQQLKLERNQVFFLVSQVQEISRTYLQDSLVAIRTKSKTKKNEYLRRLQVVEEKLQTNRKNWQQAFQACNFWITMAFDFKRMIAEKYYKFAYKKTLEAQHGTGLNISFDDLYNNYILGIYRAIDKYDADHGMLTSYIALWFKNASSNPDFPHEENVAFTIPANQRRILQKQNWTNYKGTALMNLSNPIDDQVLEQPAEEQSPSELQDQLSELGKSLNLGVFLLLSNVPYRLTEQDCKEIERNINSKEQVHGKRIRRH